MNWGKMISKTGLLLFILGVSLLMLGHLGAAEFVPDDGIYPVVMGGILYILGD